MLRKISITVALTGFAGFMTVFGLVVYRKPDPHVLAVPMLASTTMMAAGMIGVAITATRAWRAQLPRG